MDELRRMIKRFREAGHPPGSPLMIELLQGIIAAYHAINTISLYQDRKRTISVLYTVSTWEDALEREDFESLNRSPMLYGIFAL